MINGVVCHCTEMEVDKQYVDTHGQSIVAFAFCRMLGFELMPRFKDFNRQTLHRAEAEQLFPNLTTVMGVPQHSCNGRPSVMGSQKRVFMRTISRFRPVNGS